jgi:hypothetical protein
VGCLFEFQLLEVLYEEVGDNQRQWRAHSHAVTLFIKLGSETKVSGGQDMVEELQDILLKIST